MYLFSDSVINKRREKASHNINKVLGPKDLLLVFSGDPQQKPGGLDQCYPFLPHPDYYWLTGLRRPWGVLAYSVADAWVDFVKPTTQEELVWEGISSPLKGHDISDLKDWISKKNFSNVFILGLAPEAYSSLSSGDLNLKIQLQEQLNKARRHKDEAEIEIIKRAAQAAHEGYRSLSTFIRPGLTEREVAIEYERRVLSAGAHKFPYETLVGSGKNAAILHATPSSKVLKEGDLLLVDAGADIEDYCVDITRVYSVGVPLSSRQKDIYNLVLKAEMAGIEMCRPGVEWSAIHIQAARIMCEGLKDLGVFKSSVDSCLESGAISVFFPHGVGHMVGLRVRDVGGDPTRELKQYCGARLRVDFKLEENFLMTVEPGLYFIEGLMKDPQVREKYKGFIDWSVADAWSDFGGIRIEDDILVTKDIPINLTQSVPK